MAQYHLPYISVIIPVYNAKEFVEEAVHSALMQPEVAEVILVEDASPDGALAVCKHLEKLHKRVRLFQHPDGKNRGAGPSRNLGITKASCEWIAFLDADDYYLPNRFKSATKKIKEDPELVGVYSASMVFQGSKNLKLVTLKENINDYTEAMLTFKDGFFNMDGILMKKDTLGIAGGFDERLRTSEDTQLWFKSSLLGKFTGVELVKPLAMTRYHRKNTIGGKEKPSFRFYKNQALMWAYAHSFFRQKAQPKHYHTFSIQWSSQIPYNYLKLSLSQKLRWHREVLPILLWYFLPSQYTIPYWPSFLYRLYVKPLQESIKSARINLQAIILSYFPREFKDYLKRKFFGT